MSEMNTSVIRMLQRPTERESAQAVSIARYRFQRVLGAWAGDCLELRRTGGSLPVWTTDASATMTPTSFSSCADDSDHLGHRAAA